MFRKRSALTLVFVFASLLAFSQENVMPDKKPDHYSLTLGAGWSHYFNNLEYGDKNISTDFAGFSATFFWETEYRLSLGFESGYYKLFKANEELASGVQGEVDRGVIPMMFLVRMRIVDYFYLGTGFGFALITNKASGVSEHVNTNTLSLSNYQASASYIHPINNRISLGGEMKLNNYGNLNDWMYSLQVLCALKF